MVRRLVGWGEVAAGRISRLGQREGKWEVVYAGVVEGGKED